MKCSPESGQAGVEVTPEMIEVRVSVYVGFMTGAVEHSGLLTEADLVSVIYQSM